MVLTWRDDTPPVIHIISPANGTPYASIVLVTGVASDGPDAVPNQVTRVAYEVLGTTIQGNADLSPDGAFSFQFLTSGMTGTLTVRVSAYDWNGNRADLSLLLIDAGNDIPSFAAVPDNKTVELRWEDVPLTDEYIVYFTTNGTLPSESNGTVLRNAVSPVRLDSLRNGHRHIFRLQAVTSAGDDSWSDFTEAIPLSEMACAPTLTPGQNSIEVGWNPLPGTTQFEVLRSYALDGPYRNVSGLIVGTRYADTALAAGVTYFYKVRPALPGSVTSTYAAGRTSSMVAETGQQIGAFATGQAYGIVVQDDIAFVADLNHGLTIIDVSDPTYPRHLSTTEVFDPYGSKTRVESVAVDGRYAYLVCAWAQLQVFDVADPRAPEKVGGFFCDDEWPEFYGVAVADGYLYAVGTGLYTFDVSDPTDPVVLSRGRDESSRYIDEVVVRGSTAFLIDSSPGAMCLRIYDVQDPAYPVRYPNPYSLPNVRQKLAVSEDGNTAYVSDFDTSTGGLHIVDVSNRSNPARIGEPWQHWDNRIHDIDVRGNVLALIYRFEGLVILDVSDPETPRMIAYTQSLYWPMDVRLHEGLVYVADDTKGIRIFTAGLPVSDLEVASYPWAEADVQPLSVSFQGDYAVVHSSGEAVVLDVSEPTSITHVSTVPSNNLAADYLTPITVGSYRYGKTPGWPSYIGVGELTSEGVLVHHRTTGDGTWATSHLGVSGEYLYASRGQFGVDVYDIADPLAPELISTYGTHRISKVRSVHPWVYGAAGDEGFRLLSIADPRFPALHGSWAGTGRTITDAVPLGEYVFLFDSAATEIVILDLSNPANPEPVGEPFSTYLSENANVEIYGGHLFVHDEGTCMIWSVRNPAQPEYVSTFTIPGGKAFAVRGRYGFVATDERLAVVQLY